MSARGLAGTAACLAGFVLVLSMAGGLTPYDLDVATSLLLFVAIAQAWNILAGFSRQFSLGVSAFVGAGAYAAALVSIHLHWSPLLMFVSAGVVAGALALVLAGALLRLREDYFTIGSLAAALAVHAYVTNNQWLGGSAGLNLPFDNVPAPMGIFRLAALCVLLCSLCTVWLLHSPTGLRMSAVGQHEDAAVTLGVSVRQLRLGAIVLSSVLTGLAGAVLAMQQVYVEPVGSLGISWTIAAIVMTVVGGVGTFTGPFVGAVVIYLGLTKQLSEQPILGLLIEGAVLIAVVVLAPRGLWPTAVSLARRARKRGLGGNSDDSVGRAIRVDHGSQAAGAGRRTADLSQIRSSVLSAVRRHGSGPEQAAPTER